MGLRTFHATVAFAHLIREARYAFSSQSTKEKSRVFNVTFCMAGSV
jgi:hypothetical protein